MPCGLANLGAANPGPPRCQGRNFHFGGNIESRTCDAIITRRTVARHAGGGGLCMRLISLPDSGSALLLLGAMFLSGSTGVLAHDDDADALRAFGPVDPRLRADGEAIVFSYQGSLWRLPRAGGVMTRMKA